ncbi:MAG: carboxypeptidase-like regulatory domain-containing protein [Chlamydiota bacterium]|nr:carboxypeptidase-like regulatory domain-containing protein [Chlamydiota bacterium]
MEIYRAVAGRQVIIPIVSTDVSAATGTFTVSSNPADDFDVVVDGVTVTVTRAGTAAATTDAIASAITSAISATTITSIATAVSDGTSIVTLTAAANGTGGNALTISCAEGGVAASGATLSGAGTGVVVGDLTVKATSNSAYLSDPAVTLQLALSELSSSAAPGWYELRVIPPAEGAIYMSVAVGSYSTEFVIQSDFAGLDFLGETQAAATGDYVFTVKDASDNAVEGVLVRVYDSGGTSFVTSSTTNSSGKVTFALPAGTYNLRMSKSGYDFSESNPTEITVVSNASNPPVISELVPSTCAAADTIAIKGLSFHATSSEVLFGSSSVSPTAVSSDGTVLTVVVPSGSDTAVSVKVRKPDPADSTAYLTSNILSLTRS